ncbi:hypothetical protein PUN28_012025 [Cardiocondyla obscurior]|uniref:Uncharacterized protein n=1 Tax=Cardiocondyla obscurior TaxID=286306 RepID=A0AAW2FCB7_9HYME
MGLTDLIHFLDNINYNNTQKSFLSHSFPSLSKKKKKTPREEFTPQILNDSHFELDFKNYFICVIFNARRTKYYRSPLVTSSPVLRGTVVTHIRIRIQRLSLLSRRSPPPPLPFQKVSTLEADVDNQISRYSDLLAATLNSAGQISLRCRRPRIYRVILRIMNVRRMYKLTLCRLALSRRSAKVIARELPNFM